VSGTGKEKIVIAKKTMLQENTDGIDYHLNPASLDLKRK